MQRVIFALIFTLITSSTAAAAQGQGSPVQSGQANQIQTQNAGEESNLQIQLQDEVAVQTGSGSGTQGINAKMGGVSQAVEGLLSLPQKQGGIGPQVQAIAQAQDQAQTEIEGQLNKLESHQSFLKKLIGPDQQALKSLKQQMEQNQLRIQELQELQTQVANQAEATQIQELVQALVEQNTALQSQIELEESTPGFFGWLTRLFRR